MYMPCACYRYSWNPPPGVSWVSYQRFEKENDAKTYAMRARKFEHSVRVLVERHEDSGECHHAVLMFYKVKELDHGKSSDWNTSYDPNQYKREQELRARKRTLLRKALSRKKRQIEPYVKEYDEHEVLLRVLETPRKRHQRGWKDSYRPTRDRYWRPQEKNWKMLRVTQYR